MPTVIGSGATDRGRVRERNEDAFAIGDLDDDRLFDGDGVLTGTGARGLFAIVCDGMGGAAGGDVASELAARHVAAHHQHGAGSGGAVPALPFGRLDLLHRQGRHRR